MGKTDVAVNRLLSRREIFADLMNGTVYAGKQVLKPEMLRQIPNQAGILYEEAGRRRPLERRGDIRMEADFGAYSLILAGENQTGVHYAMPVRNMLYDALEYTKQIEALAYGHKMSGEKLAGDEFLSGIRREDKLVPVVTAVLYFGDRWDGAKSLHEMFRLGPETEALREYIPDYKIHLISVQELPDEAAFRSPLQQIFSMVKYNKDKKKLYRYVTEHREELRQFDDVEMTAALVLLGEQKRLAQMLAEQETEAFDMCRAIDELIEDGRTEGLAEGQTAGEERLSKLILALLRDNRQSAVEQAAKDAAFREQMYKHYGIL